ncbi:DUF2997 domain-containing protein [Arthrobacter frigidicola]|nr:DUF2997 domain-containing protein [Arthrobacter frigidicola]
MTKRITISIGSDGAITASVEGYKGPGCIDELSTVQALLPGASITDSRLTPEYFIDASQHLAESTRPVIEIEDQR